MTIKVIMIIMKLYMLVCRLTVIRKLKISYRVGSRRTVILAQEIVVI